MNIQNSYPINQSNVVGKPSQLQVSSEKFAPAPDLDTLNKGLTFDRQAWENQMNTQQSVVITHNDKIIATFAEDGSRSFSKNSDFSQAFIGASNESVIRSLQEKYGGALDVSDFAPGQGPTNADIFERMHGYRPQPPVDTHA